MSTQELDPNAEIGGTNDMGGFELPPVGDIKDGTGTAMEFTGEIKVCGEDEKSLGFELGWIEDEARKAKIFCKTITTQGLSRIVGIGQASGVFEKINASRLAAGKSAILSDKGTVKTKTLQNASFHEQLRQEIKGLRILCTITHSDAKPYKDKVTQEEKEGFAQANIGKIAPYAGKGQAAQTAGSAGDQVKSETNPNDNDGFD